MGVTVVSNTVGSRQILSDDDVDARAGAQIPNPAVTFNTFGTGPAVAALGGGPGRLRLRVTAGTGGGTLAANNIVLTFPTGTRPPRKVYVAETPPSAAGFHVSSIAANVVNIGMKAGSVASTTYDLDLIFAY